METRAPDRTETKRGLAGFPKVAPMARSIRFRFSSTCFNMPEGYCFLFAV